MQAVFQVRERVRRVAHLLQKVELIVAGELLNVGIGVGHHDVFTIDAFAQRFDLWSRGTTSWVDWGSDTNQLMIDHFAGAVRGERRIAQGAGEVREGVSDGLAGAAF